MKQNELEGLHFPVSPSQAILYERKSPGKTTLAH